MIKLSPSALSNFKRCPKCFWLDRIHKIKQPRGIFPSLPGGMDRIIKAHFDECRKEGIMPEALSGMMGYSLFSEQMNLDDWRNPFGGGLVVKIGDDAILTGGLDDLLYSKAQSLHSVLDYKTRGSAPKPGATEQYYQTQADCYDLMLNENGRKTNGKAHFAYYFPKEFKLISCVFNIQVVTINTSRENALSLCNRAIECLKNTEAPQSSVTCEMCKYVDLRQ